MFMLPNGQFKLAQIFSARYLDFVPENTINGALLLIFNIVVTLGINLCAKV